MFRQLISSLALLLVASAAQAQSSWPTKPVKILVPTAPGGTADATARMFALHLGKVLGQQFYVENRGGAGNTLGIDSVVRSPADGHTLLLGAGTITINHLVYKNLPYDVLRDLTPVTQMVSVPNVLLVHPSQPMQTLADYIAAAKAKPGQVSYGSAGVGSNLHLAMELLKVRTGIEVTHVPYKSMAQPLNDVLGGHLNYMFSDLSPALPLIRDGKLRALGVTSATRVPTANEIPTLAEAGVPGYEAVAWLMVVTRSGLPADILNRLHGELKGILAQPDVREQIARFGMIPVDSPPPEELHRYVGSETARWSKIVQQAGATGIE